jgi:hypothetical protein
MNLNTVTEVKRPTSSDEIPERREGYAWIAGGTWLFSTPQIAIQEDRVSILHRLHGGPGGVDLRRRSGTDRPRPHIILVVSAGDEVRQEVRPSAAFR